MRFVSVASRVRRLYVAGIQVREVASKEEMVLKLACRTQGDLEKARQIRVGAPAAALGNVGWDGRARPPHLARQPVQLFFGKSHGSLVNRSVSQ